MVSNLEITRDRLTSTLFLVALFHGLVIMGVSFAPEEPDPPSPYPSLDVVLVTGPTVDDSDVEDPEYFAQQTQRGSGNTAERVRAAGPLPRPDPRQNEGVIEGMDHAFAEAGQKQEAAELLATESPADILAQSTPESEFSDTEQMLPAEASPEVAPFALSEEAERARVRAEQPRELFITANTRESLIAEYLEGWKRKIEKVGTVNFPTEARRRGLTGSPTVEVAIAADGSLQEIKVRKSSGHEALDQAAISILELAAPFDPFPERVRAQYDVLRVAYEWQFLGGEIVSSSARVRTTSP